jgi:hypothetical protein
LLLLQLFHQLPAVAATLPKTASLTPLPPPVPTALSLKLTMRLRIYLLTRSPHTLHKPHLQRLPRILRHLISLHRCTPLLRLLRRRRSLNLLPLPLIVKRLLPQLIPKTLVLLMDTHRHLTRHRRMACRHRPLLTSIPQQQRQQQLMRHTLRTATQKRILTTHRSRPTRTLTRTSTCGLVIKPINLTPCLPTCLQSC